MLASSRLSIRPQAQQALTWAFQIYAVLILGSMASMSIGASLVMAALLYAGLQTEGGLRALAGAQRRDRSTWLYTQAAAVLFSACVISLMVATRAPITIGGHSVVVHLASDMAKGWYLFWPVLLVAGLSLLTLKQRERVFWTWLGCFAVLSVVGVAQYFTGWPRPQGIPYLPGRFHANLFFGHHLSLASIWIFPFFAALDAWTARRHQWLAIAVACGAVTLFFTYSRMLWVALPVGLAAWILWSLPRRAAWIALILSAIGGAGLLTLPAVRDRLANTMGTSERQALWRANLELFEMRPITGAGWHHNLEAAGWLLQQKQRSEQVFSGHAHNNFLEMLGGTGALGLLAWLVWWGVALALLKNVFATRVGFVRGLACAWIVFQINGLTQVNFWESKVLHQLMWTMGWLLLWNREIGWPAKRSAS